MEENTVLEKEAMRRWLQWLCICVWEARLRGGGIYGAGRNELRFLSAVSAWETVLFEWALRTQQGRRN